MRKRINYKNIFSMGLAVPAFSLVAVGNTHAQGVDAPSCEALGYDLTEADCAGRLFLKCPFDQTKYFCPDETSSTDCKVGDILYSDKTCSSEVISGKTPIAVVFNTERGLAIGLNVEKMKLWSTSSFDVPDLTNHSSTDSAKNDWAGKSNTNIVLNYCKSNSKSCPAFEYVNAYKTEGTNAGDWYLPSGGEINNIYENITVLNRTLSLIGKTQLATKYYWSSSEGPSGSAWGLDFSSGYLLRNYNYYYKSDDSYYVRPVLAYKDSGNSSGNSGSGDSSIGTCANPKVGDILYSDKSCSSDVVSGKTPIAVVFNAEKRRAIALQTITALWSTEDFDVSGLTNITSSSAATADWAGKNNTTIVWNYCKSNSQDCPAFDYVSAYITAGTNAGDWYLPAMGEVNNIYENKDILNNTLSQIRGTLLPISLYWSSSERSTSYAWFQNFSDGDIIGNGGNFKISGNLYVRPVLEF